MNIIQTLVNFLSLKTRAEHWPKAKVSGGISRTLAIMGGLAPGGVRNCQVDSAGQLLTRPIDLNDCEMVSSGKLTDIAWHEVGVCNFILYNGHIVIDRRNDVLIHAKLGETGKIIKVPLAVYPVFESAYALYTTLHGEFWVTCDRIKFTLPQNEIHFTYSAFKLPER